MVERDETLVAGKKVVEMVPVGQNLMRAVGTVSSERCIYNHLGAVVAF
jgi:hypothetical protein